MHAEFLRDGPGRAFLRDLIDAKIFSGYITQAWKHVTWLPLLKPSRPPEESGSYRPISLTSAVAKVAERIVDARLRPHPCCCIAPQQAAYQRGCRTEDVFARLLDFTNRAWNKGHDSIYVPRMGRLRTSAGAGGPASRCWTCTAHSTTLPTTNCFCCCDEARTQPTS